MLDLRVVRRLYPVLDVANRHALVDDPAHDLFGSPGHLREDLREPHADVLTRTPGVHPGEHLVDPYVAELPIEVGQADGRVAIERLELFEPRESQPLGLLDGGDVLQHGDGAAPRAFGLEGLDVDEPDTLLGRVLPGDSG
jgi:hypothetical protein